MIHNSRFTFRISRFENAISLAVYLALALILTWPLAAQFGDHVLGTETWAFDEYSFVWSQWWIKHALFNLGESPLTTQFVFYPLGVNLASFTMLWLNALLGLPLQLAFGLIPAVNATVLATYVLGAFGMYGLANYLLRQTGWDARWAQFAALIAGIVYSFSSARMVYAALGHYNILTSQWLPFYALFLIKTMRAPGIKNPILASVFAGFSLYSDPTQAQLLVLLTLVFLLFEWRALWQRATFTRLVVLGAATLVGFAPLLVPLVNEFVLSGYKLPGWGHAENLLVDLMGFFAPTSLHPLNRYWEQELDQVRQQTARFRDVQTFFVGYATGALALLGAVVYRKRLRFWIASVFVFAAFALGPLLNINGRAVFDLDGLSVTFPMPFLLLHYIPLLKENRVPNRYSILVALALAVLVAYAVGWASQKLRAQSVWAAGAVPLIAALAILFEHLAVPLPLSDARVPAVYAQIARDPGDFAVLSLPLGWRNSFMTQGAEDTRTQYYQSEHQKFLLSGNTSRNPPFLFEYFDRIALFHSLAEIEMYREVSDETLAQDRAAAPFLAAFFDLRYVVINAAVPRRVPYSDTRDAMTDYARAVLPLGEKIYDRDGVLAYRLQQAALPAQQQIAFGTPAAYPYQAEGWERGEWIARENANWANQPTARILFPIRELADYQITLRALPYVYSQMPTQTLELIVNDQPIQKFDLRADWHDYAVTIPARVLHSGLNNLVLRFSSVARPRDVQPANFLIGATGASSPADVVVNSGNLGSIKVNGREVSPLGRGYNVVVIDPASGAVVTARSFNTTDDRAQSRLMTDFLNQLPRGVIVAVAAQESAGTNLGDRTVAALQTLGAHVDLRATPQNAHALIGVKGAARGTALEQTHTGGAFLAVGHNPDERTLAGAISRLVIEKR